MGIEIGVLYVRRSVLIQASPQRVWEEFTSEERIRRWLDLGHSVHTFEPRMGGLVDMSADIDGEPYHFGGRIVAFDAERELSFESQWQAPSPWTVPTFWTIRLTGLYDATQVEIYHHGFERLGAAAADNLCDYEEGWDVKHLLTLRSIVEGASPN